MFCGFHFGLFVFFFFNDTATTEIYTLSLHDALPISPNASGRGSHSCPGSRSRWGRSEEHTSELQSHSDLVCRLLLEKKKNNIRPLRRPHQITTIPEECDSDRLR